MELLKSNLAFKRRYNGHKFKVPTNNVHARLYGQGLRMTRRRRLCNPTLALLFIICTKILLSVLATLYLLIYVNKSKLV